MQHASYNFEILRKKNAEMIAINSINNAGTLETLRPSSASTFAERTAEFQLTAFFSTKLAFNQSLENDKRCVGVWQRTRRLPPTHVRVATGASGPIKCSDWPFCLTELKCSCQTSRKVWALEVCVSFPLFECFSSDSVRARTAVATC
jgi:hypothetical protein